MKTIKIILSALVLAFTASTADAYVGLCCGKCGGNMPLNIPGGGVPETHELRLKFQPMYMRMSGLRDGTSSVDGSALTSGMTPEFMAAPTAMDMHMINLSAGYSFTDDIFGGVMLMWKRNSMDMAFGPMMAGMAGTSGFTMDSEGIGDTMLMGKYRLFADNPFMPTSQASLFFGLSVPTGSIDERNTNHPVAARAAELLPYAMQLGSGTFDPSVGILYQGSASPWWWGANLTYTARTYSNERDYRLGNELRLDLYGMYQLRYDTVVELQLGGVYTGEITGEMDEASSGASGRSGMTASGYTTPQWDPENYGGRVVNATVGVQWQPMPLHILNLQFGVPVYQDLNGPRLEEDYRVMLTWYAEIPTKKSRRHAPGSTEPGGGRLGF